MKNIFFSFLFLGLSISNNANAQELVVNGGFESYNALPTGVAQWWKCNSWNNVNMNTGATVTYATPDYYHANANQVQGYSLPSNLRGYLNANTGNAIMGFLTDNNAVANFREYISNTLAAPMVVGQNYTVSFWLSNAEDTQQRQYGESTNRIGMRFSTAPLTQATNGVINVVPQLEIPGIVWNNTWTLYTFSYTATSAWTHITIGNFYNDANTSVAVADPTATYTAGAYYFIDDVSIVPCTIPTMTITPSMLGCGSATLTVNTSAGAPTYAWTGAGTITSPAAMSTAVNGVGTYTVNVTDAGCTASATYTISANAPTAIVTTPANPTCGNANGSVALGAVTGGTGPYTYNFNGLGLSSTTNYGSLAAGNYTLVVQDALGCSFNAPNVVLTNAGGITAIASTPANPTCGNATGSVALGAVTGGTGPYTYNFNGLGLSSNTNFSSLAAGNYTLVVQDALGCSYTAPNIVLTNAGGITAIATTPTNPTCGNANGSVALGAVTGGTGPYTYNFNGLGLSSNTNYSSLAAGNYTLLVQDALGCSYTAPNIVLTNAGGITAIASTPANPTCGNANGSVALGAVTGGTGPYTYNFNGLGFSSTTNYSSLAAGNYTLLVQDALGCSYTAPNIVLTNAGGITAIATTPTNPACGNANGSVALGAVTGGTAPYTFNFNGLGFSSTTNYSSLAAGNYTLVVQDALGCSYNAPNVSLVNPGGVSAIVTTPTNPTCGNSNGLIVLGAVTGGTAPYSFNFNGSGFSSTTNYSNLAAGNYTFVVQDALGCSYNAPNVVLTNSNGLISAQYGFVEPGCGDANGSITVLSTTGGTPPYLYSFNNSTFDSGTLFTELSAGNYTIIIQDNNGCAVSNVVTLNPKDSEESVFIPNCFTPDGNAINNEWFITGSCVLSLKCAIYNRWGERIIELNSLNEKWDGTYQGKSVQDGVYFYVAEIGFYSGKTKVMHGHISVIR